MHGALSCWCSFRTDGLRRGPRSFGARKSPLLARTTREKWGTNDKQCWLQRAQEVQQILLLAGVEGTEVAFDGGCFAALTLMVLDGRQEIFRAAIVKKEDPLAQSPEGSSAELISASAALRDVVGEQRAHVMNLEIAVSVDANITQAAGDIGFLRRSGRGIVADRTSDGAEQRCSVGNGTGSDRCTIQDHRSSKWRSERSHEVGEG